MSQTVTIERTALCATRPTPEEVQRILKPLGFSLGFHIPAQKATHSQPTPLAAQHHFRSNDGTEAIYLAGPDSSDGRLVKHHSRFWVYGGASPPAAHEAMDTLAHAYALAWSDVRPDEDEDVA